MNRGVLTQANAPRECWKVDTVNRTPTDSPLNPLPWPATAAALTALAALYLSARRFTPAGSIVGLPMMAVAPVAVLLIATHFTQRRLPRRRAFGWLARLAGL